MLRVLSVLGFAFISTLSAAGQDCAAILSFDYQPNEKERFDKVSSESQKFLAMTDEELEEQHRRGGGSGGFIDVSGYFKAGGKEGKKGKELLRYVRNQITEAARNESRRTATEMSVTYDERKDQIAAWRDCVLRKFRLEEEKERIRAATQLAIDIKVTATTREQATIQLSFNGPRGSTKPRIKDFAGSFGVRNLRQLNAAHGGEAFDERTLLIERSNPSESAYIKVNFARAFWDSVTEVVPPKTMPSKPWGEPITGRNVFNPTNEEVMPALARAGLVRKVVLNWDKEIGEQN